MGTYTLYLVTFLAAISGFLFGYDTGVISGAMLFLVDEFHLSSFMQELTVSVTVAAAAIMSLVGGVVNNYFGRRKTILAASMMFLIGAVVMAAASHVGMLIAGRAIIGIAIGLSSMTTPVYLTECSPTSIRGTLVSVNVLFITGGQFVASLLAGAFSYDKISGWRYMLGLAAVPAALQLVGFLFLPESPRWLIQHDRDDEARAVMTRLRGQQSEDEMVVIRNNASVNEGGGCVIRAILKNSAVRRALLIGCMLQLFQQIVGVNTVMYYSATIIKMSGISDNTKAIWMSSVTSCTNFLFTVVGIVLVDRIGRRKLLLGSLAGIFVSLALLGLGFFLISSHSPRVTIQHTQSPCSHISSCESCIKTEGCGFCYYSSPINDAIQNATCLPYNVTSTVTSHTCNTSIPHHDGAWISSWTTDNCPTQYAWVVVLALVVYLAFFAPGMGPMPWTINSEIFPTWARSTANSVTTTTNWLGNLLVSLTFLSLVEAASKAGAFFLYASFALVAFAFFLLVLPETKGRQLEGIEELFSGSCFVYESCGKERRTVSVYQHLTNVGSDVDSDG